MLKAWLWGYLVNHITFEQTEVYKEREREMATQKERENERTVQARKARMKNEENWRNI